MAGRSSNWFSNMGNIFGASAAFRYSNHIAIDMIVDMFLKY